jgi:hypothetical protein
MIVNTWGAVNTWVSEQPQTIGVVTATFSDDLYKSKFAENKISLNFKPNQITVIFTTQNY